MNCVFKVIGSTQIEQQQNIHNMDGDSLYLLIRKDPTLSENCLWILCIKVQDDTSTHIEQHTD